MKKTLAEIASFLDGEYSGDGDIKIGAVSEIQNAHDGDISFLTNMRYKRYVDSTRASALVVSHDTDIDFSNIIRVKNPGLAIARLIQLFHPARLEATPGIDATAVIDPSVEIPADTCIGPCVVIGKGAVIGNKVQVHGGVVIGDNVQIGNSVVLYSNVTLYPGTILKDRVIIHAGTVIGSDGFGFTRADGKIEKIPQIGGTVVEDDVEIGANCTVDRGAIGDTVIGKGSKLDNLIQIAHNVKIGRYCFIAAQTGIAGSTILEDYVTCAGQVGIAGHLRVGRGAVIASQAGVTKDVPPGKVLSGYPAKDHMKARREEAFLRSSPEIIRRIKALENRSIPVNRIESHEKTIYNQTIRFNIGNRFTHRC